uniref:CMP/dCMP-type deaminase domain-containing protein n=1 Tax=Leptobrachium leishanense TaxID=445787 RepID=A0A8C5WKW8_9ANUR
MIPMSSQIFCSHYAPYTHPPATHLCYEVYRNEVLVDSGHLANSGDHAERIFLGERFHHSWRPCTIKWYISWSPCDHCMEILLNTFLPANPDIRLFIFFAKRFHHTSSNNIRELRRRGVRIYVMTSPDFRHCWEEFVDNNQQPFEPWNNLRSNNTKAHQWLMDAFQGHV